MKTTITLLLLAFLAGCGAGDGAGLDQNGQPIDGQPDPTPAPEPDPQELQATLESIQDNVLTPICTQCHIGNNAPLGLRMDDLETSIANLIDVDSATNPQFKRINPGQTAEQSFLFLKIIGDPQAGNQMPLGQTPLDNDTIEVFRNWIESGAPIDNQQLVVAQAKVTRTPKPQQISVELHFSQNISPSSLQAGDIQIIETSNFAKKTLNSDTFELKWKGEKQLNLTGLNFNPDSESLTIRLNQNNLSSVFSQSGVWLDGDRDGIPGGEFNHEHQL
jgi:hypothetical protein